MDFKTGFIRFFCRFDSHNGCRACSFFFFFKAKDGIRDPLVTGVQTCALPISEVRRLIVDKGIRVDGRSVKEVRPIWSEVRYLPRAHGSALFTRGETQAL